MAPLDPVHIGPFIRDPFSGEKKNNPGHKIWDMNGKVYWIRIQMQKKYCNTGD